MTTTTDDGIGCVLITGGTGSFGKAFTRYVLKYSTVKIRIYSRDEAKQEHMERELPDSRITFIIGDVRDEAKLTQAAHGADAIVHAAALKRIPAGQQHTDEFVKTNVGGTSSAIVAALKAGVGRNLFISSDKAVLPITEYGKTKSVAEGLWIHANRKGVTRGCRFASVRGGNIWDSRGSVMESWRAAAREGRTATVTDPTVTRFHMRMEDWCAFAWRALREMRGGEIFVPKLRAWKLNDVALAFKREFPKLDFNVLNRLRDGEKPDEWLISIYEAGHTVQTDWCFVVEPSEAMRAVWGYRAWSGQPMDADTEYRSNLVSWLSVDEIRRMINVNT